MLLNLLKVNLKTIEDLDTEYNRRRKELTDYLKVIVKSAGKDLPQDVIDFIYWESGLSSELLSNALGVGQNALRNKVSVYELAIPCSKCGDSIIHRVRTKSQLADKKSFAKGNPVLCDECIANELEKTRAREQKKKEKQKTKKQAEITILQDMPYDDYLKTDHWKRVKKAAISRANCRCTKCGRSHVPLDVHHLNYEHRGYEYPSDLKVVCRNCHEKIHGRKFDLSEKVTK